MNRYYPEGFLINSIENRNALKSLSSMYEAMADGRILEAKVSVCDNNHNLILNLPCIKGIIPHNEGAVGIDDGSTRDIALISRVNKPVCFKITEIRNDENGNKYAVLSRKAAQLECYEQYINNFVSGEIIEAKVTHLEKFGCFVDIGCGIPSLIPIDAISVSRISHPSDRFYIGENIKVIVKSVDNGKVWLTHKELLGTWEENANLFNVGETVAGIVRSVENYGIFVELTPNLAGLAELKENINVGQSTSVYIKAIIPEKMKIKLNIVDVFDSDNSIPQADYFINEGIIKEWEYSTKESPKKITTVFE